MAEFISGLQHKNFCSSLIYGRSDLPNQLINTLTEELFSLSALADAKVFFSSTYHSVKIWQTALFVNGYLQMLLKFLSCF